MWTGSFHADYSEEKPHSHTTEYKDKKDKIKQGKLTGLSQTLILIVANGNHQLVPQICDKAAQHKLSYFNNLTTPIS